MKPVFHLVENHFNLVHRFGTLRDFVFLKDEALVLFKKKKTNPISSEKKILTAVKQAT